MAKHDPRNQAIYRTDRQIAGVSLLTAAFSTLVFAPHVHEELVIAITEQGAGRCVTRGVSAVGTPQTVMVFNPGEPHEGGVAGAQGWHYRSLYVGPELLELARDRLFDRRIALPYFRDSVVCDPDLAALVVRAHQALELREARLIRETLLLGALAGLFGRHGNPAPPQGRPGRERQPVRKVMSLMRDAPAHDWSLAELADTAGMSPFHFCRAFRKETGLTPHLYLTQIRLDMARDALARGAGVADAALAAGFYDQSHLTRHFKRSYGITPGRYVAGLG